MISAKKNKKQFLFMIINWLVISVFAQENKALTEPVGYRFLSASVQLPLGNFSNTHFIGAGISYTMIGKINMDSTGELKKRLTWKAEGGSLFYSGKKEETDLYAYKYPLYTVLYLSGGGLFCLTKKTTLDLALGPALGLYDGTARFTLYSKVHGSYTIHKKIGIGPELLMLKEKTSDPLWGGSLRVSYTF